MPKQWQTVIDRPGLTAEQREGAQFAARHLPFALFEGLTDEQQATLLRYAQNHSQDQPSLVLCWEHSTPETLSKPFLEVENAGRAQRGERQARGQNRVGTAFQADDSDHWTRTASNGGGQGTQGLPITLTWSFVPDGTIIPGGEVAGEGSNEPSNLRVWLAQIYGGSTNGPAANEPWFPVFQAVFDNIAAKTGMRYVYEPNDDGATLDFSSFSTSGDGVLGVRGDIRISGHRLDGNSSVLAYNYFSNFGGDMVIDTDDNFFDVISGDSLRLRNVVEHEHGHGLGLSHVCPVDNTKLMEPYINLAFTGIQFDDIFTIQRLYGDFLEVHGAARNNDSFANATPINAGVGIPFAAEWLGIDDNSDTDYFSFSATADAQVTVRVNPSTANYLEGAQAGSCGAGSPFDSSTLQNLGLTLYAPDQSTVVGSAVSQPAGTPEEINALPLSSTGTHYVRVTGSGEDVNQLYRLELEVAIPGFSVDLEAVALAAELLPTPNGAPDPGETVSLDIALSNSGAEPVTNLVAVLSGPAGFQGFDVSQSYGDLDPGASSSAEFVFALNGPCGEELSLQLDLTADGQPAGVLPLPLVIGLKTVLLEEDFEASGSLPAGWSTTETGQGSLWTVVESPSSPGQNSAFSENRSKSGQSLLTTPTVSVGATPGNLVLNHSYDTETAWDGGVLEIAIGAGAWQDFLAAGGSFLSGGYDTTLNTSQGQGNPLRGREAWSGNSGGLVSTLAALPPASANQDIRLRLILGHDNRIGRDGWYIEELALADVSCESGIPALTLSSLDASMSEYSNVTDTAVVTVSAALPVSANLPVSLATSGLASPVTDVGGFGDLTLLAGSASTSLVLTAISDGLVEGNETFTITSPDASGSVEITILDTPYGQFASATLGVSGSVNPFDDFDEDTSLNIEELVFGTDLNSATSMPQFVLQPAGMDYKLPAALSALPAGILAAGETSTNLQTWMTNEVTLLPDGFLIPGGAAQRFLRLNYSVEEIAP